MTSTQLQQIMFIDIETVPQTAAFDDLSNEMQHLWEDKFLLLKKRIPEKYEEISYMEVLEKDLKVMDSTATAMCRDNHMPLLVFGIEDPENIVRAVKGEKIGTIVK